MLILLEWEVLRMTESFKKGDPVTWSTSQGEAVGKVIKKQTSRTTIKDHDVAASTENPEYIVESDKSGKRAAHKPESLHKKR
jgi:hypothetical protein